MPSTFSNPACIKQNNFKYLHYMTSCRQSSTVVVVEIHQFLLFLENLMLTYVSIGRDNISVFPKKTM